MNNLNDIYKYLKSRKWIDLAHNINSDIPYFSSDEPISEEIITTKENDGYLVKKYCFYSAYSTHLDAPIHFSNDYLKSVSDFDLKELVVPLYVLRLEDKVEQNYDYTVSVTDILKFEQQHGKIEDNSFVAFCSNWSKRWFDSKKFYNYDALQQAHTPGWSIEAIRFLVNERNICGIGHETLDTDASIDITNSGYFWAQHEILNSNKFQIELMNNLDRLPPTGAIIFINVLKIDNAPSFPVSVFAIIDEQE